MKYISHLVSAASGSIRGCTFTRGNAGTIIRGRPNQKQSTSPPKARIQSFLSLLTTRWTSLLSPAARAAWNTWAINTPSVDALGQTVTPSGQNAYIASNVLRLQAALPTNDFPPTRFSTTPLYPLTFTPPEESVGFLIFTFDNTDPWATALGGALLVYISRPVNPSAPSPRVPLLLSGIVYGDATPPLAPGFSPFPFPTRAGQAVHIRFRAVDSTGRISLPLRYFTTMIP